MNHSPILSAVTLSDVRRMIRRERRQVRRLKTIIDILEPSPPEEKKLAVWLLLIVLFHISVVTSALIVQFFQP